jgi:Ca2+-transporting ATPase
VFESEPASRDIMQRPPRPPTERLISARSLAATLLQGAVMFVPVLATDVLARGRGWALAQVGAMDFTALVAGNLAMIALYRPGASLFGVMRHRNRAFAIVAMATLLLLLLITRVASAAHWFGFVPPPIGPWCLALVAPFVVAALLKRWDPRN